MDKLTSDEKIRYSRNMKIPGFGIAGQERLKGSRVFILGCGALGSIAALYLAGAGVGEIIIADFDTVDISNLQRQLAFVSEDAGFPKSGKLAERLRALNPGISVREENCFISLKEAYKYVGESDFVIDGSDNPATKYMIDAVCRELGKPYCLGGVSGMTGQFFTFVPGSAAYSDLFPEKADDEGMLPCSIGGVLGPMPGIIGSFQAAEAIKYITKCGRLFTDRITMIDLREATIDSFLF